MRSKNSPCTGDRTEHQPACEDTPARLLSHRLRAGSLRLGGALALMLMMGSSGCDPCFGISSCDQEGETFAYSMRIVDPQGRPVEGIVLEVVPESGVSLVEGRLQGVTDANGLVEITGTPTEAGELTVGVEVTRPGQGYYRVDGVTLETTRAGNRLHFGNFRSNPYVSFVLEVVQRASGDTVSVTAAGFERTGGVTASEDTVAIGRNSAGSLALHLEVDELGDLEGNVTLRPAQRDTVLLVPDLRLPSFVLRDTAVWVQVRVGPSLAYAGRVLLPLEGRIPAAGVKVAFQQTGGMPLVEDSIEVETNRDGLFPIFVRPVDPWEEGEVVGRLHIAPSATYEPIEVEEIRLTTFDADSVRLIDEWRLAPATVAEP